MHIVFAALVALQLSAATAGSASPAPPKYAPEHIVLAGGCFWGMEAVFDHLKGVSKVVAGYAGGSKATAYYDIVSSGLTGHAESVQITFDPSQISLHQIFDVYFLVAHDPTQLDYQGPDRGKQYRSAIFYSDDTQKRAALEYIKELQEAKTFSAQIVTQVVPLPAFYPAEAHHQHYVANNPNDPYVVYEDLPKLEHLHKRFPQLVTSKS